VPMIRLALLWHMHQPFYQDLVTGEHILPWVRMHALKDYRGMVDVLEPFAGVKATFNLVPSLVVQLQAFADGRARDRHLTVGLAPAASLSSDDRTFLGANGFHAAYHRMIAPYPRYLELYGQRESVGAWPVGAVRDLQVWHKLVWMDPDWLARDARLQGLLEKGRDFSEDDKAVLAAIEGELITSTVPTYRRAQARGQIELSTSPFYHPILPLLCDTDAHLAAHPQANRPQHPFRRPVDAREQVARAVRFHTETFGQAPLGMWPSEGSVSNPIVPILAAEGLRWFATDEHVLARTLGELLPRDGDGLPLRPEDLYRPYEVNTGGARARVLFRDHNLSDRIGFAYQSWEPHHAADDFVWRVRESARRFAERAPGETPTITVVLDGENAWEHYAGGGRPFLRELYGRLQAAADIETVTMATAAEGPARVLDHVFPGSWIHADFYIWAGHRDDQRAWSQLSQARAVFDERAPFVPSAARDRAYEELLIAEGSDWFWWYGDDHSSAQDKEFDELFRRHVRNAYEALGLEPPAELFATNISTGPNGPSVGGVMERAD
jgi:alpha-amylase/alpha-mannosidase (GH57 family)